MAPLLVMLIAPAALAQVSVSLEVQSDKVYVNEPVTITISVENAQESQPPEFPDLPDCTVEYRGSATQMEWRQSLGGSPVTVSQRSYRYLLIAHKTGPWKIPPMPVVADGKTYKTHATKLMVLDVPRSPSPRAAPDEEPAADSDELLLAEITCEQSKLYVGQQADLTLSVWIKPARYQGQPLSLRDMRQLLTGQISPFDPKSERDSSRHRIAADGSREPYYLLEFTGSMIVDKPGPLSLDNVSLGINYPTRFSRTPIFGDLRISGQRPLRVRPTIATPDVQPLPTEGRPANFSGAVGRYELSAFITSSNVRVGDPIQLVIDISGEPIETIPGPDLASNAQLVEDFRVPDETLAGTVRGHTKRFTQTIRAKRPDVKWVPPIEFSYFDPEAETYAVASSEPIPIMVSVVEQLDATDLTGISAEPTPDQGTSLEVRDGLRGIKTGESTLLSTVQPVTLTQVALATFAPPAVFICAWGFAAVNRSRRDRAYQRRRAALRNAERRIARALDHKHQPGEFPREIQSALAGYLGDRLNEPPARFLGRTAVTFLEERGVDRELVTRWSELIERCEHAAYAGGGHADASLADLARRCARELEGERL